MVEGLKAFDHLCIFFTYDWPHTEEKFHYYPIRLKGFAFTIASRADHNYFSIMGATGLLFINIRIWSFMQLKKTSMASLLLSLGARLTYSLT